MFEGLLHFLTGVDDDRQSGGTDDASFALAVLLMRLPAATTGSSFVIIERALARRFGLGLRVTVTFTRAPNRHSSYGIK
jgi:hypothetical protein